MQRPPRECQRDLPLLDWHLHYLSRSQVEVQPIDFCHGLHCDLALLWNDLVANCLHARRYGSYRGQHVDPMRQQPQWVCLSLFILNRDRNHHWVWLPGHHGQVSRGNYTAFSAVCFRFYRQRFHGWLHVCENIPTQEEGRNLGFFYKCSNFHAGWKAVSDVPSRRP